MGQYLAIGITTKLIIDKSKLEKAKLSIDEAKEALTKKYHFVQDLYNFDEDNENYVFTLKDELVHTQLLPLLRELYPLLYQDETDYSDVLKKLTDKDPSTWLQWAENKPEHAFQMDGYGERDYIKGKSFSRSVPIYHYSLMLSMEGKIIMETYGRHFTFFKYTMMKSFPEFNLAGAFRVYITG